MCTAITSHIYFLYNLFDSSLQIFLASSEYLGNLKHLVTVIIFILNISVKDFFGSPVSSLIVQRKDSFIFIPLGNRHGHKKMLFLIVMQTKNKFLFQAFEQHRNTSQALGSRVSF